MSVKPPTFVVFVNDKNLMHFHTQDISRTGSGILFGFRGTALKFITRERKGRRMMILARILALVCGYFWNIPDRIYIW